MIDVDKFYKKLIKNQIEFFTGVPDSLLKSFCAYIKDTTDEDKNILAANEGNAVGIASGYYLASKKIGLVYMQNSGLGNIVNPIASLDDKLVYNIPVFLLVGWRGEPGKKDEPQHKKQGMITLETLELLNIKHSVIDEFTDDNQAEEIIDKACEYMRETNEPYAVVVKKNAFKEYELKNSIYNDFEMSREEAIETMLDSINDSSVIVSTTGMISRELFELRDKKKQEHNRDFLTVGSMGHASQIALGIAMTEKSRNIYCFDGDGAMLMHLGGIPVIGNKKPENFKHILFNNGAHDSVGGQDTVGLNINIPLIAEASGYVKVYSCSTKEELKRYSQIIRECKGPALLEIKVRKGACKDLGRPNKTPIENKEAFMNFIRQ
ncbi:phosphonopyruvate decarboxylase [Clostridium butyricum]|uniref:phosphonopyruvate decarboxylase n=1 Tax=Clostridium butyricum TaxID=1492 RepID=UPI00325ABADE